CEESFQYPDRSFGGIYFYRLDRGAYLAQVVCTLGAYQGSQIFLRVQPPESGFGMRSKVLTFEVLEAVGSNGDQLRAQVQSELWGTAEFDPQARHLTLLNRFRGIGDCGI